MEINPFDIGPEHVLRALTAVDEDQHAAIRFAEVAAAIELQLLAVRERHPGALFAAGQHYRGDQAERNRIVHA